MGIKRNKFADKIAKESINLAMIFTDLYTSIDFIQNIKMRKQSKIVTTWSNRIDLQYIYNNTDFKKRDNNTIKRISRLGLRHACIGHTGLF